MKESDLTEAELALHGVSLAHTSLISALFGILRATGALSADQVNLVFDAALLTAENCPEMGEEPARRARQILETIHGEVSKVQGP